MSTSSASERISSTAHATPASAAQPLVALAAAGAEARRDHLAAASAAARWSRVPWRSGTITTSARRASRAPAARRARRGRAPGSRRATSRTRWRPAPTARCDAERGRRAAGRSSRVVGRSSAPYAARERLDAAARAVTTTTSSSAASGAARQHVGDHRLARARAAGPSPTSSASRCLAASKRLTGSTAIVRSARALSGQPLGEAQRLARRRARALRRVAHERRRACGRRRRAAAVGGLVGDDPVEQRRRTARRCPPRRAARPPTP